MFTVKMEINDALLTSMTTEVTATVAQIVTKAARDVEGHVKTEIQTGSKTGHAYGKHRASAPGEAPATDMGGLVAGISVRDVFLLTKEVVSTAEQSEVLELGGVHVEARPFMAPAVEAVRPSFEAAVAAVVK